MTKPIANMCSGLQALARWAGAISGAEELGNDSSGLRVLAADELSTCV